VIAKLAEDLAALRAQLSEAGAAIARERATHAHTRTALQQRVVDVERLAQQARVWVPFYETDVPQGAKALKHAVRGSGYILA
jgi:hypothetical protein